MSRYLEDVEERGFYELVGDAFIYPLRGQGKSLLVVGALFFMVVHWVQHYMLMAFVLTIVMAGYLCAFMFSIVSRSASGDPEPPGWPDISDAYEDIVRPLLVVVVGAIVVSMLPAIVLEPGPHLSDGWRTVEAALIAVSARAASTCRWRCSASA